VALGGTVVQIGCGTMAPIGTMRTGGKGNRTLMTTRQLVYSLRPMASPMIMTAVGWMGTAIISHRIGIVCARKLFEIISTNDKN